MEPMSLRIHVDIDCETGEQFRSLVLWWMDALAGLMPGERGTSEAGRVKVEWGYAQEAGPILASEDNQNPRQEFSEVLRRGFGSGSYEVVGIAPVNQVKVTGSSLPGEPDKVKLYVFVGFHPDLATTADVDAAEEELIRLITLFTEEWQPLFANLSDDTTEYTLALDAAQGMNQRVSRLQSGELLRSYSWVTFVRAGLVDRLGGAERLRATDAFYRVLECRGGLLLQATRHLRDYEGPAVAAVRAALEPVLRDRPTRRCHLATRQLRIAWDEGIAGPFGYPARYEEMAQLARSGKQWQPPRNGSHSENS